MLKKIGLIGSIASIIGLYAAFSQNNNAVNISKSTNISDVEKIDLSNSEEKINNQTQYRNRDYKPTYMKSGKDIFVNNSYYPNNTHNPQRLMKFQPISHLKEKIDNLWLPTEKPNITLHLVSKHWKINHYFKVSKNIEIGELKSELFRQLSLGDNVDFSAFQQNSCPKSINWGLSINGKVYDTDSHTLEELKIKNKAIIQFRIIALVDCGAG